uniref:Uncharacterized protein n=1 Tax=Glossina pallidipes TaxID=7398 RepID=A0A1A9ZI38_GLOPL
MYLVTNQNFINGERSHMAANRKPSIGRDEQILQRFQLYQDSNSNQARYYQQQQADAEQSNSSNRIHFQGLSKDKFQIKRNQELIKELKSDSLFQRQKEKHSHPPSCPCSTDCINNGNSYANSLIYSLPYSNQKSRSNTDCYSPHLYEPFSYYGADNNRNLLQDDDYHLDQSLLYDETNDNSVNATVAPYDMIEENSYKKSAQCSTPNICETIFRSLHKPRREFVQQNLIWNIPFSHSFSTSPASMPEINYGLRRARVDSPQKSCKLPNQAHKRQSPYRTVSHFGFKSPQRFSKPDHKHVPAPSEPKKYVPLRRSISYEEIFSSPRYVDLCEHCFEQIVRLKPELMSYRAKLRNLAECPIAPNCPTISNANNTKMVETGTGANLETLPNSYDLETVASEISEPIAAFSSSLEPLLEVEERESSDDRTPSAIVNTKLSTINSFIEKISSMSFSEEPDANYLSARLTSKVSIPILNASVNAEETRSSGKLKESADETFENEAVASNDKVLEHQEDENVRKEDKEDSNNCNSAHFVSITEIWEFGDWMDSKEERVQNEKRTQNEEHASSEGHLQNAKSDLLLEDTDEKNSEGITSTKTQTDEIVTLNKAERVSLSSSVGLEEEQQLENFDSNEKTGYSSSRSLTNRTDQEGRNIEFQELWGEDHITNCENREQGYSSTFSDDGSAIEGHQQQNFDQDRESFRSSISQNLGTEVFHGHSLIIRSSSVRPLHKIDYSDPNEQTVHNDIHLSQQSSNDDCHSSSHRTFSLSEPSSSNENLLIRSYGCTNLAADFAYRRIERRSCERTVETFIGNKRIDRTTFEDLDNVPEASSTLDFKRSYGSFQIEEKQSSEVNTSDEKEYNKAEGEGRSNEVEIVEITDAFSDEGHNVDEEDKYIYELESVDDRIVVNDGGDDDHNKVIEREWDIQSNVSDSSEYISQNVENLQIEKIDEVLARNRNEATLESNDPTQVQEEYAESEDNLQQFSTMEREILKKIELHQLNKSAEIFNKIESSIRNKLTPSKLELLVKQNSLGKSVIENTSTPQVNTNFHTSTPTKLEDHEKQTNSTEQTMMGLALNEPLSGEDTQQVFCRRSCSFDKYTSPSNKFSNAIVPSQPSSARLNPEIRSTSGSASKTSVNSAHTGRRNFIMENIRNAAKPRYQTNRRRLRNTSQTVLFSKVPLSPRTTLSNNSLHRVSNARRLGATEVASDLNLLTASNSSILSASAPNVYSFQSKSVRGSPRFWVSLSESPLRTKKSMAIASGRGKIHKRTLKKNKNMELQQNIDNKENSLDSLNKKSISARDPKVTETLTASNCHASISVHSFVITSETETTRVDAEISALGEEIQKIQPRLDTYQSRLADFGDRVARCARNMDECAATQQDLINEQKEFKERIVKQQYVEDVTCRVSPYLKLKIDSNKSGNE